MTENINRRSLAKGAAWAAPAVLATAAIPAYAASSCTPELVVSPGVTFYQTSGTTPGIINGQTRISFGLVGVKNLPEGVTIRNISVTYDVEQRNGTRSAIVPGHPSPRETYVSKQTGASAYSSTAWSVGSSYSFYDTKNNWSGNRVTFVGENRSVPWQDGISRPSWAVTNTWSAGTAGDPRVLVDTTQPGGCRTSTLREMGQLTMQATFGSTNFRSLTYVTIKVTLSDGQELSIAGQTG